MDGKMEEWKNGRKEGSREGSKSVSDRERTYLLHPLETLSLRITPPLLTFPYPHGYLPHIDICRSFKQYFCLCE